MTSSGRKLEHDRGAGHPWVPTGRHVGIPVGNRSRCTCDLFPTGIQGSRYEILQNLTCLQDSLKMLKWLLFDVSSTARAVWHVLCLCRYTCYPQVPVGNTHFPRVFGGSRYGFCKSQYLQVRVQVHLQVHPCHALAYSVGFRYYLI